MLVLLVLLGVVVLLRLGLEETVVGVALQFRIRDVIVYFMGVLLFIVRWMGVLEGNFWGGNGEWKARVWGESGRGVRS